MSSLTGRICYFTVVEAQFALLFIMLDDILDRSQEQEVVNRKAVEQIESQFAV